MTNTVVGVYDNFAQAQSALKQLLASGFSTLDARLRPPEDTPQARLAALKAAGVTDAESQSEGGTLRSFFRNLFGSAESRETHADRYAEAVRRGSFVLTVDAATEQQRDAAVSIMEQFHPVDIDERATTWQASGWRAHDETAAPLTDEELARERDYHRVGQGPAGAQPIAQATQDTPKSAIPVIEEELQVGKREVQRGGVRVFQRVIETPVQETVSLRQEHVTVERHAVDQPATAADLDALREGSVELREMAEEAVVSKTARVVEEVVIGKEVSEKQATISDTVRRTDVEVENLGAGTAMQDTGVDEDFHQHWQQAYGQSGERFEEYAPAYQYGSTLAHDPRYQGHDWARDEPAIRKQWESAHANHPWEKVKDAVRHGWSRVTH